MSADVKFYLALLKKRLPEMVLIFALCAAVGLVLALTLPPRFEANARLLVESAQIPGEMVVSTVQTSAEKQLQIIEERLMTRANMIDVANKYGVFPDQSEMEPGDVFRAMRDMTSIRVSPGNIRQATVMTIAFRGGDPSTAANVVNEFVTLVERESAGIRQLQAGQTAEFFESEVARLSDELSRKSGQIVAFKEANKDALPEELTYRLERQTQVQERLNLAARDRASLNEQRNRLLAVGSVSTIPAPSLSPEQQRLAELRNELNGALAVYSESNPRVRGLRAQIAQLESTMTGTSGANGSTDPLQNVLDLQIAEVDSRIEFLDDDIARGERELENLRVAIEKTPQNAIRLEALDRDYSNVQLQYNESVSSLAKAKIGESIEVQGKGERVSVIERAVPPTSPSSPNRKLVAGGGVFAGTALATVFFVLTELLNRMIRRPADLVRGLGVQPLATIPYIEREDVRKRRRYFTIFALMAILVAIAAGLWAVHTYYLPLDLLAERMLDALGL